MNTSDRVAASSLAGALRRHDFGPGATAASHDVDTQVEIVLRAIRVRGGDREAAISAGHRALARSVAGR